MKFLKMIRAKITRLFKKKPKKVSLMEMANKIGKIAHENTEGYYSITAEIKYFNEKEPPVITLSGYINGFKHSEGKTIDEVCKKLRDYKNQPVEENKIADVLMDDLPF